MLRNFKIGKRAGIIFSGLAFLMIIMVFLNFNEMRKMNNISEEVAEEWIPALVFLDKITNNIGRIRTLTFRVLISNDQTKISEEIKLIYNIRDEIIKELDNYESSLDDGEDKTRFDVFKSYYIEYIKMQDRVLTSISSDHNQTAKVLIETSLNNIANQMIVALNSLREYNTNGAIALSHETREAYNFAIKEIVFSLIAIFLTMFSVSLYFTRSIVNPLRQAVQTAEQIAANDLTHSIYFDGQDEPAALLQSLSLMQANLRKTIGKIGSSAEQLASSAEELHVVTEDTNKTLSDQNHQVDQAAIAVNEMTAAIEEVANNASTTAEVSHSANNATLEGREIVVNTLQSTQELIEDIERSASEIQSLADQSSKIAQVMDMINEIADQINLLALNAAIEAARAGDAGRGFAVVADEVRKLAHRTQTSTDDIELIINDMNQGTIRAVDSMGKSKQSAYGTMTLSKKAEQALQAIYESMSLINDRNHSIATASEEQSLVAREVDRNLISIRDLAVQTAAASNQTSASSQELSRLAVELNNLISEFKV
ncbi:methyl-accepting chemotaxis protein [Vibrio furnissii]|uniref:methyl-accepting chemotaxis protein n=1 Tax=Vibrio furnissii TaxID=29494 RepID=UPI0025730FA6|nr:methyl-accepting chemotaxis protein [Vibrio furnissii]WJG27832.1 methyl-accepting chemotaxis protein [Vibrio furnissii]